MPKQKKDARCSNLSKARDAISKKNKNSFALERGFKRETNGSIRVTNKTQQGVFDSAGSVFNKRFHYYNHKFNCLNQLKKVEKVYGTMKPTKSDIEQVVLSDVTDTTGEILPVKSVAAVDIHWQKKYNDTESFRTQIGGATLNQDNTPVKNAHNNTTIPTFRSTPTQINQVMEWTRKHTLSCGSCQKNRSGKNNIQVTETVHKRCGTAVSLCVVCTASQTRHRIPPEMINIHVWCEGHSKYLTETISVARAGFDDVVHHVLANGNGHAEYLRLHPNGYGPTTYNKYKFIIGRHIVWHEKKIENLAQQLSIHDMKKNNTLSVPVDADGKWEGLDGYHCVFRALARESKLVMRSMYMSRSDCHGKIDHLSDGDIEMSNIVGKQKLWEGTSHTMESQLALETFREMLDWGIALEPVMDGDGKLQLMLRIACTMQALKNAAKSREELIHSASQYRSEGFPPNVAAEVASEEMLEADPSTVAFCGLNKDTALKILAAYTGCLNHALRALFVRVGKMEDLTSKVYKISSPATVLHGYKVADVEIAVDALEKLSTSAAIAQGKSVYIAKRGSSSKKKEPLVAQALSLWGELVGSIEWKSIETSIRIQKGFDNADSAPAGLVDFVCSQREITPGEKALTVLILKLKTEVNNGTHACNRSAGQSKDFTVKKSVHPSMIWTLLRRALIDVVDRMENQNKNNNSKKKNEIKEESESDKEDNGENNEGAVQLDLGVELLEVHRLVMIHLETEGQCTTCPEGWHKEQKRGTLPLQDPLHLAMVSIEILELMISICKGNGYLPGVGLVHQTSAESSFSGLQNLTPVLGSIGWSSWRMYGALNVINHSGAQIRRLAAIEEYRPILSRNGYSAQHNGHAKIWSGLGMPLGDKELKNSMKRFIAAEKKAVHRKLPEQVQRRKEVKNIKYTLTRGERSTAAAATIDKQLHDLQSAINSNAAELFKTHMEANLKYGAAANENNTIGKAQSDGAVPVADEHSEVLAAQKFTQVALISIMPPSRANKVTKSSNTSNSSTSSSGTRTRTNRENLYTRAMHVINDGNQDSPHASKYNTGDGICALRALLFLLYGRAGQKNSMLEAALDDILKAIKDPEFMLHSTVMPLTFKSKRFSALKNILATKKIIVEAWKKGKKNMDKKGKMIIKGKGKYIGLIGHIGKNNMNSYSLDVTWNTVSGGIRPWFGPDIFDILINYRIRVRQVNPLQFAPMLVIDPSNGGKTQENSVTAQAKVLWLFIVTKNIDGPEYTLSQWMNISINHAVYLCVKHSEVPPRATRFTLGCHYDVNFIKKAQWNQVLTRFKSTPVPADLPAPKLTQQVKITPPALQKKRKKSKKSKLDVSVLSVKKART